MRVQVRELPRMAARSSVAGACSMFIPVERNDYRPLALRHKPLAFISALLMVAKLFSFGVLALTPAQAELSTITVNRIVQLTNQEREKAGLQALSINANLATAAHEKGEHMLEEDYFAHVSPSGVTPWFWMQKHGYSYQVAGENLAIDFIEAEDVVAAWLASPTHKENMLLPTYTETGVGVVTGEFQGGTSTVVVHMFGLPTGQAAPETPASAAQPSPSPTPAPTLAPTPPPDTTPPRTPRIALVGSATEVQNKVTLRIFGEPESTVALLVNNQQRATLNLGAEPLTHTLALDGLVDGALTVKGYATDAAGNQSDTSAALTLVKDTISPTLTPELFHYVLSPATDQATVLASREGETAVLQDLAAANLAPRFDSTDQVATSSTPGRFSKNVRTFTTAIAILISVLLTISTLIKIRIQHPGLIAHSSAVIVLAVALLFV